MFIRLMNEIMATELQPLTSFSLKRKEAIPEDIIFEILLRLPVKSLLRMKSVSKTLFDLISSSHFVRMHNNLGNYSQLIISNDRIHEDQYIAVFSFRSNKSLDISPAPDLEIPSDGSDNSYTVGSLNGIVCFYDPSSIFLCNPTTREFKDLPPTSFQSGDDVKFYNYLNPAFGFDSSNIYDLKVISIYNMFAKEGTYKGFRAEVFTLSSKIWRQLDWVGQHFDIRGSLRNKFCGNSCHWHIESHGSRYASILCFDMHTESFKTIDFPRDVVFSTKNNNNVGITVFKEYLCAFAYSKEQSTEDECLHIWIMKEYGVEESWTKLCTFGPLLFGLKQQLSFWMDDQALLVRIDHKKSVPCQQDTLVSCNLNTGETDYLEFCWPMSYCHIVLHKETLISIN